MAGVDAEDSAGDDVDPSLEMVDSGSVLLVELEELANPIEEEGVVLLPEDVEPLCFRCSLGREGVQTRLKFFAAIFKPVKATFESVKALVELPDVDLLEVTIPSIGLVGW